MSEVITYSNKKKRKRKGPFRSSHLNNIHLAQTEYIKHKESIAIRS